MPILIKNESFNNIFLWKLYFIGNILNSFKNTHLNIL